MSATHVLIEVLGEISLLLWGIHMVQSGVMRAYGSNLRLLLGVALKNRTQAFLAGLGVTAILQSSTATAMMASSFAAAGLVGLVPALAVMLGANVGTTLIVQLLSFDVTVIFPVLLFAGVLGFRKGRGRARDLGRAAIGLGLVLVALHLMIETMEPVERAPLLRELLATMSGSPLLNILIAAIFTWAAHSSVAVMLFIVSLAGAQVIGVDAALAMVLGANLGSAINPVVAAMGSGLQSLRMPLGNLANRVVGVATAFPLLPLIGGLAAKAGVAPSRLATDFHTVFNLVLALAFIFPLPLLARLLERLLPERGKPQDAGLPLYLDADALATPPAALANASREALRMADVAESMLQRLDGIFVRDDRRLIAEIRRMDDVIDDLNEAIRRYLAAIDQSVLNEDERQRLNEILVFAGNIENAGDTIEKSILDLARKRLKRNLRLSGEGLSDIEEMREQLIAQLKLAVGAFMLSDISMARKLVSGKERFRRLEKGSEARHFARMRAGRRESLETTGLHVDIVRDLKQIGGFLAATAYPLLERSGQLKSSRLS
jgi:phosphate:Na+ symporter